MQPLTQPILVGVTGAGENTDALSFALSEARTLNVGLTLVHAVNSRLPAPPPSVMITDDTWFQVGHGIVDDVRREFEALPESKSVPVSTALHNGDPGSVFGELSKNASMIVLQHRDLSRMHRIVTGSTVASVASHAHCPVVSVPAGGGQQPETKVITAGLHGDGGPRQVLETAFATASSHHCSLRLVHAWRLAAAYDDLLANEARWMADDEATITTQVDEMRAKYPDVTVEIEVRHDWPVDVLLDAAAKSELLVVGRHAGLPVMPHRLGSMSRAVIAHASAPVMVVPV